MKLPQQTIELLPDNGQRMAVLCGQLDENLHTIESYLGVEIACRANIITIAGKTESVKIAVAVLERVFEKTEHAKHLAPNEIHLALREYSHQEKTKHTAKEFGNFTIRTPEENIKPRSENQYLYLKNIKDFDITFGIGSAGTGKTYLAVAAAVEALENETVGRIVLVRPAVEAGEKLGFLPGDLSEKVDPYLRPIYDALYEMMGFSKVERLIEKNVIEIAPLAFMRGRTLSDAFVILDEAQNTTIMQMKMFLTRIGFGSKAVITGDITQTDLPHHQISGLRHAVNILKDVPTIAFSFFEASDVVRHPIVQQIIEAYETADLAKKQEQKRERST